MSKIGLIAGMGKLPELFLNNAIKNGFDVSVVYLFENVEESIKKFKNSKKYSIGQAGKVISHFKKEGVSSLVMLGKVEKSLIYSNLKFDITALTILYKSKNKKDKNLIKSVIDYMNSKEIEILPQTFLLEDIVVREKNYTKIEPSKEDEKTIKIGIEAAKMLTNIDAGQSVVVKNEGVVALEGIEGTDKTISRGGELAGKECIVVKMARKNQDFRIDVPTIGLETIKKIVEIKGKGIVIEAEKMLFIDQDQVIEYANKHKIFIKGIKYE